MITDVLLIPHCQYPLHLLSLQSVAALESVVKKDENLDYLDPRRFRANIIGETLQLFGG